MACILINDEVQSTFSIKDLEKDIIDNVRNYKPFSKRLSNE